MRMLHLWLSGMVLVACGGDVAPRTPAPATAPASAPVVVPLIDIRPITITFGGLPIARLLADGRTEAVGQNPPGGAMSPGPRLHADGRIELTGATARLARSGELYVTRPGAAATLAAQITTDHLAIGTQLGVHLEGDMLVFDAGRDDVGKLEGPVDAGLRHTALVMFAAFFLDQAPAP